MFFTLGHGTLAPTAFLRLAEDLDAIADVRSYPGSRRAPHYAREELERWLPEAGLRYRWVPALGGRRRAPRDLPRGGWEQPAFAAYAWAMADAAWLAAAEDLVGRAGAPGGLREGLLCAETLWWRCHRSMIADYLVWRGLDVVHLQPEPTNHRDVLGDRLERYPLGVIAAWEAWQTSQEPRAG